MLKQVQHDDLLVGFIALGLVIAIAWRIARGVRIGELPVYRTTIARADNGAKFSALLALHILSLIAVAVVAADLLLGLGLRD